MRAAPSVAFALAFALALSVLHVGHAFTLASHLLRQRGQQVGGAEGLLVGEEYYFEDQALDHIDIHDGRTWRQRYFVNDTFFDADAASPVFLCVGGEGPALQPAVVVTGTEHCAWMVDMAKEYKALIVALEHRFYGKSLPLPDYSGASLKYLSSKQALGDLAHFRSFLTTEFGLGPKSRWVTFGGSYPGMMAAWSRMKYPHLFHGSISSSAPVQAILDFEGYNNVVAGSMADPVVGGSATCLLNIQEAFAEVGTKLKTASGRSDLRSSFGLCDKSTLEGDGDAQLFAESLMMVFPLQSNDPSCAGQYCNYAKLCDLFHNSTSEQPIDHLASLLGFFMKQWDMDCLDIDHAQEIKDLQSPDNQDRSWLWQTCTEFGFYQTCNPSTECPFVKDPWLSKLQSSLDMCEQVFGIEGNLTTKLVGLSNEFYGGWRNDGTRIAFVNGDVDPWSAAGMVHPNNLEQGTLLVTGASHHAWTHIEKDTDSDDIKRARGWIKASVDKILDTGPTRLGGLGAHEHGRKTGTTR